MWRVVITGSRHWTNYRQIKDHLQGLLAEHPDLEIAHGHSRGGGADSMAEMAAFELGIPSWPYPVRKDLDGNHRGAPLNRNKRMVRDFNPDAGVAYRAEGKSNGTDHCVECMENQGVPVEIVKEK